MASSSQDPNEPRNEKEAQALKTLKELISEQSSELSKTPSEGGAYVVAASDAERLRFLRGHKLHPETALKLMKKTGAWRVTFRADELVAEMESTALMARFARAYLPMGTIGRDKLDRPVIMSRLGAVDFPRVLNDLSLEVCVRYAIYVQERLVRTEPRGECAVLIDLGQDDLANPPITSLMEARAWIAALLRFLQPFAAAVEPNYPETFAKIFFTRAPRMFAAVWSVAKNFLNANTAEKIDIIASKPLEKLSEYMSLETIPAFLGGKNGLEGIGGGGKLGKGQAAEESYVQQLESDMAARVASKTPVVPIIPKETDADDPIQQRTALEALKLAILAVGNSSDEAKLRGSWKFVPGLDEIAKYDDEVLEQALRENEYDPQRAYTKLIEKAQAKDTVKVPEVTLTTTEAPLKDEASQTPASGRELQKRRSFISRLTGKR